MDTVPVRHYVWAGLDFMFDQEGMPVLLDANRASHMMMEYGDLIGDERPFALVAARMNQAGGTPCLLWRRGDPFPDAVEDACWIGRHLSKHLDRTPEICNVEDNQIPRVELTVRDGRVIQPGSVFRWWYGLPWSYERAGIPVVNPNCLWTIVRDKLLYSRQMASARHFRVAAGFAVEHRAQAAAIIEERRDLFTGGFVLKPRVGWGGFGVQVGEPGEAPREFRGSYLLCERIRPPFRKGRYWDVRVFVMSGQYLGGIEYSSEKPVTNFHQGGVASPVEDRLAERLREPALEAVSLIDALADRVHARPEPPDTDLVNVVY